MNTLSFIHFFSFLVFLWIMAFILQKSHKQTLNRIAALFCFCFVVWNFGAAFMRSAPTKETAMLWQNISSFGWISFASVFLWQAVVFTGKKKLLKSKVFYIAVFGIPAFLIYKQWTGFLINDFVRLPWGWHNIWTETIWPPLFFLYYILFNVLSFVIVLNYGKKTEVFYKKKQALIIFYAMLICLVLGTVTDVVLPRMNIHLIPPLASVFALFWVGGVVYAITKYGLMSITPQSAAENILSSMSDSLILVNPEGVIASINNATEKLFGYKERDLVGRVAGTVINGDREEKDQRVFEGLLKGQAVKDFETSYRTRDDRSIPVNLSGSPVFDREGRMVGAVLIAHDMRETIKRNRELEESYQKQAEMREKLVKAEMQEKLNRQEKLATIGRLAGSVGHEIRTPLASIKNAVFYLERYGGIQDSDASEYLRILVEEVNRAEEIVNSLLDFSRTTKVNPADIEIKQAFERAEDAVKDHKEVEIVKNVEPDAATIKADPVKFEQLMKNLLKNACQAIDGPGRVEINSRRAGGGIEIDVSDTGEGMDEATVQRIYEPLFTTKPSGIGLGMSIIKDIVDAHGWDLRVESEKGKGTLFAIKTTRFTTS